MPRTQTHSQQPKSAETNTTLECLSRFVMYSLLQVCHPDSNRELKEFRELFVIEVAFQGLLCRLLRFCFISIGIGVVCAVFVTLCSCWPSGSLLLTADVG